MVERYFYIATRMKGNEESARMNENASLRETILIKYETYRLLDPYRFPAIELNTNRANYEPLRKSFEEEFYVKRGISRLNNNLHIPSANTLSFIFNDNTFLPGRRILNTCQSYADIELGHDFKDTEPPQVATFPLRNTSVRKAIFLGSIVLLSLSSYFIINYIKQRSAKNLTLDYSHHNQVISRPLILEGSASANDSVWIVIHPIGRAKNGMTPEGWNEYYLASPTLVDKLGHWKREIYIGRIGIEDIGVRFQIRVFVNLENKGLIKSGSEPQLLSSWPEAELASEVLEVIRGPEVVDSVFH